MPIILDYIKQNTQIDLIIAVDFTKSNDKQDLHSIDLSKNQYFKAIKSVSQVLVEYDNDKTCKMYGFGGIPKFKDYLFDDVQHCFNLTGNKNNAEAEELEGIIKTYVNSLGNIEKDTPTLFSPLLKHVMKLAQQSQINQMKQVKNDIYYVLLILTDGVILDMKETKECLVDCAYLPLSIVIIGIGNEDFTKMVDLDGDLGLRDYNRRLAKRDLVQFVEFNKFKTNEEILSQQVLEELPDQFIQYMEMNGRTPEFLLSCNQICEQLLAESMAPVKKVERENKFQNSKTYRDPMDEDGSPIEIRQIQSQTNL